MNLPNTQRRRIEALVATGSWPRLAEAMHRIISSCYCCTPDCVYDGCGCSHGEGIEIEPTVADAIVGLEQDVALYARAYEGQSLDTEIAGRYGLYEVVFTYGMMGLNESVRQRFNPFDVSTRLDALLSVAENIKIG